MLTRIKIWFWEIIKIIIEESWRFYSMFFEEHKWCILSSIACVGHMYDLSHVLGLFLPGPCTIERIKNLYHSMNLCHLWLLEKHLTWVELTWAILKFLNFDVERMEVLFDLHILIMSNRYLEVTTELWAHIHVVQLGLDFFWTLRGGQFYFV